MKNSLFVNQRPYKYLATSEKTNGIIKLAFLGPQLLLLAVSKSYMSLAIILSTCVASVGVELIDNNYNKKNAFHYITAVINGILIGLFLPSNYPVYAALTISFLTIATCRFLIGKNADCWINTVALSVCVCWLLGMQVFPTYQINQQILLMRNPALELIQNGTIPMLGVDAKITSFFNRTIFSLFGVSIPDGYISLFWDTQSLIPAFRFNLITLITSIVLISIDVVKPLIPGIYILVYGILIYFASPFFYGAMSGQGDLLLALLTSGILLSILFLLQDTGKTPLSLWGKISYAVIAGMLAFLVVGPGTSPAGAVFVVLIMNVVSPIIQNLEHYFEMKHTKNELMEKVNEFREGLDA